MTGTLYGDAQFHWVRGFVFGAALGAVAAVIVYFKCKPPTLAERNAAVAMAQAKERSAAAQPAVL
jgi:hypothetical protein